MSMEMTETIAGEIRHWPALPERPTVTSADLARLIAIAAQRRLEMGPPPALGPYDCPEEPHFQADRYSLDLSPGTETVRVWSRLPGIGWVLLVLEARVLQDAVQKVLSLAPSHEHSLLTH